MKKLLKKICPTSVWTISRQLWLCARYEGHRERCRHLMFQRSLRRKIIRCLSSLSQEELTPEKKEVLDYLKNNSAASNPSWNVFPYEYTKKYTPENIPVFKDETNGLPYVLHENKRLYFKRETPEKDVREYYADILAEQDVDSPHCYETDDFHVHEGEVIVDAGVAEGNFALSVVERAAKLYLFEPDKSWMEALLATFSPWKDKVVIINKAISNVDDGLSVSLDNFDFGNDKITFIKADIEGAERLLLSGASKLLFEARPMRLVLCTYHKQDDAAVLEKMLRSRGFQTGFSKRYMIYPGDKEIAAPYLRRGLIRAQKTGNPLELDENCQTPTPEYSIVLPVFKTKYFKEAFDSVAKQSFGDYEIVVMNDEADGDITWVKENPRVRYFENHPRLGPTQNWNRGLCFCRGKFVLVFSDDDILEPNFLEEVDKFLREHNFEMDVVRVLRADVNEAGEIQLFSAPGRPVESLSEFFYNQYFFNRIHALQDFVFCRETALAIGGFKNFPRGMYSDLLFLVEIAAGKDKVGNLNKLLVRFRIHGMNLSRFKDKNFYFDMLSSAFGFYSGVRVALRNSLGVYQKFVGQVNESFLQKNTYSCYSGMILNYGVRALWRLHCKAPDGVDKIQSLSRAISWYFYYRFKKVLFYPKQLFLRKMR